MSSLREEQERLSATQYKLIPEGVTISARSVSVGAEQEPGESLESLETTGFLPWLNHLFAAPAGPVTSSTECGAKRANVLRAKLTINELEAKWIKSHLPKAEIAEIQDLATTIFGDEKIAIAWLREPNVAMDDQPPVDLLGTPEGFERVKNLLLRIQYGVLA